MLEQFLPSVVRNTSQRWADVVVADNGSDDDSIDFLRREFPDVKIISMERNFGFAEGYNRAIASCDSEYVVLLNSDVETPEGWIEPLVEYMEEHPEVVACQPKILSYTEKEKFEHAGAAGGFVDNYGFPYCRGRIFSEVEEDRGQYDEVTQVFWATGAALFIRRKEYLSVGGLDATFFAHMEEIDLCWRLNSRGKKLVCVPQSHVFHLGGGTLNTSSPRKTYLNFRNNLLMIFKNETEDRLSKVLFMRKILDNVAALMFLLKGEKENFKAVRKARKEFKKVKLEYQHKREENLKEQIICEYPYNYKKSIVFAFYALQKRYFHQL
jgi:GT2 family glycosyltransferase